ncbi:MULTISPECIES: competence protein CoiA [Virgibacillus]|uniref:Competence protein CoiA n=1 Tax=Virgibacillus salarius TaxID=447199 RepID=A0A941DZQ1_9BACI|nr:MULTISPECIES: competence protein CoiA family protein [Bacillaceae]MBR7798327.1 hypothetical protein [Virgibacillus salarius]MDY7045434.1 competence protein CoiA family protein [Virgibacillus sp. M23]NAZ11035.1 hypothetical protein [Agaribacter marinus]
MLQAIAQTGEIVLLSIKTRHEIEQLRKQTFYCPICKQQVIMKAGAEVIPHFAHYSSSHCRIREDGEGAYHESGKLILYQWLKAQKLNVTLEPFLNEIQQRPDILLTVNTKKIALEYQCATIPISIITARNKGYQAAGITPIWILGAKHFKRETASKFRLSPFTSSFIHQFPTSQSLKVFFFCPITRYFITAQNIYFTTSFKALGKFVITKLKHLIFTDIFKEISFPKQELYPLWLKEKMLFRTKSRVRTTKQEFLWLKWLYIKQHHVETLPSLIYLPISSQIRMNKPLWLWQSKIILDHIAPLSVGTKMDVRFIGRLLNKQTRSISQTPLLLKTKNPLIEYMSLLEQLKIVKQNAPFIYTKRIPVFVPSTLERALEEDQLIINQLQKQNKSMIHK